MGCAIYGKNKDFVSPIIARQVLLKAGQTESRRFRALKGPETCTIGVAT